MTNLTGTQGERQIDLLKYAVLLFSRRYRIGGFTLAVAVVTAVISLMLPKSYRADATLLPNESDQMSGIQRLAQMTGFAMEEARNTSQLYPQILTSRKIMRQVILRTYPTEAAAESVNLLEYWYPDAVESPAELLEKAFKKLKYEVLSVHRDELNGMITLGVVTGEPGLSADIANTCIRLLDEYNREFRKIKAKEQRKFIEDRLTEVADDLARAENRLKVFRERNRRLIDSPNLLLEQERLIRNVKLNGDLYGELKKQYEIVKIEEIKNMPVVDVLDEAIPPVKRCFPKRKFMVIMAALAAMATASAFLILTNVYHEFYRDQFHRYRH